MMLVAGSNQLVKSCRSIIDSIAQHYPDRLVLEPRITQNVREIYTETHFALAQILLALVGVEPQRRLSDANTRLQRWKALDNGPAFEIKANPFNNLANCLSLILLRRFGAAHAGLTATLQLLCAAQRLEFSEVSGRRSGNNMYIMAVFTQLLLRPMALGEVPGNVDVARALAELDRYRSPEGFYFDAPRHGGPPQFPLTYCMKFLFLVGLVAVLHGDPRFHTRFLQGMRAVLPFATRQGGLGYFGRSDNTAFAAGLTVFCLRLAVALEPHNFEAYTTLARHQIASYDRIPRHAGGWMQINRFGDSGEHAETRWAADGYNFPTEYSCASACYLLLSEVLAGTPGGSEQEVPRALTCWSRDLGIAVLRRGDGELVCRFGSNPEVVDRRYWGPSILRFASGDSLLVGAVPRTCATEFAVRYNGVTGLARNLARIWHYATVGPGEYDVAACGFVPVLWLGSEMCFPGAPLSVEVEDDTVRSVHPMLCGRRRGIGMAWAEMADVASRTLLGQQRPRPRPPLHTLTCRLTRSCRLGDQTVTLHDKIEAAPVGSRLLFGLRAFANARWEVEGLTFRRRHLAWGSDGLSTVALYTTECKHDVVEYSAYLVRA